MGQFDLRASGLTIGTTRDTRESVVRIAVLKKQVPPSLTGVIGKIETVPDSLVVGHVVERTVAVVLGASGEPSVLGNVDPDLALRHVVDVLDGIRKSEWVLTDRSPGPIVRYLSDEDVLGLLHAERSRRRQQ